MQDLVIEWKEDGTHLYEQIYQYIRDEIRRGKLLCQEKLPSTRSLAEYLQVSRSTVELAYDQLVAEGYLEAVPYKGYFVARVEELYQMETAPEAGITSHEQAGSFSRADAGGDCLFLSDASFAAPHDFPISACIPWRDLQTGADRGWSGKRLSADAAPLCFRENNHSGV